MTWERYIPDSQSPGRAQVVTWSPNGQLRVLAALAATWPKKHPFVLYDYDGEGGLLRLTPCPKWQTGAAKVTRCSNGARTLVMAAQGLASRYGLVTRKLVCPAHWESGAIIAELPGSQGSGIGVQPSAKPKPARERPKAKVPESAQVAVLDAAVAHKDFVPLAKRRCELCTSWRVRAGGMVCTNRESPHANMLTGSASRCEHFVLRTP